MAIGSVANACKFVKLFRPYMDQLLTWKLLLPFTTSEAKRKTIEINFFFKKKKVNGGLPTSTISCFSNVESRSIMFKQFFFNFIFLFLHLWICICIQVGLINRFQKLLVEREEWKDEMKISTIWHMPSNSFTS